jgi:uncharacterized membrane protein YhhN
LNFEPLNFSKSTFFIFISVLAGDLLGIITAEPLLRFIFKPLIVPAIALHFLLVSRGSSTFIRKRVLAALFFSWAGDVMLLFEDRGSAFFMAGLGSFLLAHVFYILVFFKLRGGERSAGASWLILPVAAYYALLMALLTPYLGTLEWPVRIYGLVICLMLLLALQLYFRDRRPANLQIAAGALLFVISDSLLALNKFYRPFEMAGLLVMLTYAFAQWLIVGGVAKVERTENRVQRTEP